LSKVKDKKKKTPYQRKYTKTYNATWEVNISSFNSIGRKRR